MCMCTCVFMHVEKAEQIDEQRDEIKLNFTMKIIKIYYIHHFRLSILLKRAYL